MRDARNQRRTEFTILLELVRATGGRPPLSRVASPVYFLLQSNILTTLMATNPTGMYLSILQVGTIFNLVDSLTCGMIGILAIAESRQFSLDKAQGALRFIRRMVSNLHRLRMSCLPLLFVELPSVFNASCLSATDGKPQHHDNSLEYI